MHNKYHHIQLRWKESQNNSGNDVYSNISNFVGFTNKMQKSHSLCRHTTYTPVSDIIYPNNMHIFSTWYVVHGSTM